jgi:hypothetical protein
MFTNTNFSEGHNTNWGLESGGCNQIMGIIVKESNEKNVYLKISENSDTFPLSQIAIEC